MSPYPWRQLITHGVSEMIPRYADETLHVIHDENGLLPGRPPMSKEDIEAVLGAAL